MKILLVCQKIDPQVQFLATQLEVMGFNTELIDYLHPVRLLVNRYDVIHFIHNIERINLRTLFSAWTSQALGAATILTSYSKYQPSFFNDLELSSFHAVTTPFISELKKLRSFKGQKILLPYFPVITNITTTKQQNHNDEKKSFIIPIQSGFEELSKIKFNQIDFYKSADSLFYIDASFLRNHPENLIKSSALRKTWQKFVTTHPEYKKFILFTEKTSREELLKQTQVFTFIHHLDLSSYELSHWMSTVIEYDNTLILNEDQGTGFSDFWKNETNCFVFSNKTTVAAQYTLLNQFLFQFLQPGTNSNTAKLNSVNLKNPPKSPAEQIIELRKSLDLKLNDLARLYTKVAQQRTSLMPYTSVK